MKYSSRLDPSECFFLAHVHIDLISHATFKVPGNLFHLGAAARAEWSCPNPGLRGLISGLGDLVTHCVLNIKALHAQLG